MSEELSDEGIDITEECRRPIEYDGMCKLLFPTDPSFDEKWAKIWNVMEPILNGKGVTHDEWAGVFIDVYQLCNARPNHLAQRLYEKVSGVLDNHINVIRDSLKGLEDVPFFKELHVQSQKIRIVAKYLSSLFLHLNTFISHFLRENQLFDLLSESRKRHCLVSVEQLIQKMWREKILDASTIRVSTIVLNCFDLHRVGKPIENVSILKDVVGCFIMADEPSPEPNPIGIRSLFTVPNSLALYRSGIEDSVKKSCTTYYDNCLTKWASISDNVVYINNISELISSEKSLTDALLHPTTTENIDEWVAISLVKHKVLSSKLTFKEQMNNEEFNEAHLKRCYNVLKLINNGLSNLCEEFSEHVNESVKNEVAGGFNDSRKFVTTVGKVCDRYYGIAKRVFYNHPMFVSAVDKAVRSTVNASIAGQPKPGEKVARYADQVLRKSSQDDDHHIIQLMNVLKFIADKDQFERSYQVLLANRLLGRVALDVYRENHAVERMRGICSPEFVQRCARMCLDVEKSSTECSDFWRENASDAEKLRHPIECTVIQTGSWPLQIGQEDPGPATPAYVIDTLQAFNNFYLKIHTGRQLTWAPSLSTVDVRLTYLDRPYLITMTTIHFDILTCFEEKNTFTLEELGAKARLIPEFLKRYCKPLVDNQILTIHKADDWTPFSSISLNFNFSRKNAKLRLPVPMTNRSLKYDIRPEVTGDQVIAEANRHYIDSVIVRELKRAQQIKHTELWTIVLEKVKTRFIPTVPIFKQCIESLIERGYLKRSPEAMDEYIYIA